jgi:uncharacterized membrane protein
VRIRPWLRKALLATHLTVSIGWIGSLAAYLVFDVAVVTGEDAETLRTGYLAMDRIVRFTVVPFAVASFVTGVLVSVWSRWGLFRHYWVVISLVLTSFALLVLLREVGVVASLARTAAASDSAEHLRALGSTLPHSVGGTVLLLIVLVLNVYKPRGLTRYGRRMAGG